MQKIPQIGPAQLLSMDRLHAELAGIYARKGAVAALIIHRTDLASYGWSVVKNSNSGERTFLRDDANPRLKAASWSSLATSWIADQKFRKC